MGQVNLMGFDVAGCGVRTLDQELLDELDLSSWEHHGVC